jgi:outer membrane protein OmpA-like peptidoglycan-associated protein
VKVPTTASFAPVGRLLLAALLALAAGCATPPKPPELDAFEKLRADPSATAAAKRSPDLVNAADRWLARSQEEWRSNDLDEAVNSALMGQIKLKHAMAVSEQDRAKTRSAAADAELERAKDEDVRLEKELAALNEQLALLKRLQAQTVELGAEKKQLETERQKGLAAEKIGDAELAIKTADTLNAGKHAKGQYAAAADLLARAQQELQQGNFPAAQISADMAKKKADEAAEAAKPLYQEEAKSAESRAQAEALGRDAAAIAGIMVRRDARGALQRWVLPIPADLLFFRRETTIANGKGGVLDQVAALVKKYPSFPVQVIGYTDSRGRSGELLALSLARAQSVYSALITRGVDARRLVVSGQGSAEPISDNRTVAGRAQNNRVEIVFVYQ